MIALPLTTQTPAPGLPMRDGAITVAALIDLYFAHYTGRDTTRAQRLNWWRGQVGALRLDEISDDQLHDALERLTSQPARFYAGQDADDRPIYKAKKKPLTGSTVNRYSSAISSVFTWAIRRRIAPKGFDHPVRRIERQAETAEKTRFLSDDERGRLLDACKASPWPRLYLLVLVAVTTGARRGELLALRWRDVDTARKVAHIGRTKNGDPKALPLVPSVVEQFERHRGAPGALVFPSRLNPDKPMCFDQRWREALTQAGVRHFRWHDLRHSAASMLAMNGATLLEIADLLGHRQISMTHRYAHLATNHRAALVDRVMGQVR